MVLQGKVQVCIHLCCPHIALFTIKAVQCGRVDLKTAPYDTIQLKQGPSWLDKKCSEFGQPLYPASAHSVRIPVFELLLQVQLEAVLWGIGTALGELPPYFISRADHAYWQLTVVPLLENCWNPKIVYYIFFRSLSISPRRSAHCWCFICQATSL